MRGRVGDIDAVEQFGRTMQIYATQTEDALWGVRDAIAALEERAENLRMRRDQAIRATEAELSDVLVQLGHCDPDSGESAAVRAVAEERRRELEGHQDARRELAEAMRPFDTRVGEHRDAAARLAALLPEVTAVGGALIEQMAALRRYRVT